MLKNRALVLCGAVTTALYVGAVSGGGPSPLAARTPLPAQHSAISLSTPPTSAGPAATLPVARPTHGAPAPRIGARGIEIAALNDVVRRYCAGCHNARQRRGNLSLDGFDIDSAPARLSAVEQTIRKLRTQMMPPPTSRKPAGDTLLALVETLEQVVDNAAKPNPGTRTFQRLNRPEYEAAVRDLLGVKVDAADFLPLDTKSANFDNIADVQSISPTLLDAYLTAAAAVSRMALGDRDAVAIPVSYRQSPFVSQHPWDRAEGAPYGTRGGIVTTHSFPADGYYVFRVNVGGGVGTKFEDIDVSIDGTRLALLPYEKGVERTFASADAPQGADFVRTEPILVKAGQQVVSATFVRRADGPYEDLIRPHDWSMASNGNASAGTTAPPHVVDFTIIGPDSVLGMSESASRKLVFSCYPTTKAAEAPCASQIIKRLATRAYRRPLAARDTEALMKFYRSGAENGGFEGGIRNAVQAMLASPYFLFRFEKTPANVAEGASFKISDVELASRLSFFLWGSIPDDQLLSLAASGQLSRQAVLDAQVKRMLADPKAEALATRFAAQWLRLQDLDKVRPDAFWFPDFNQQLADAMYRETELVFADVVRNDASVLDLFTADWTYVNERLGRHYGIPKVSGTYFRRVNYPDSARRGLLGHGSILVQTSFANRTSPVLRGKWVMEVLLNMPPPPPPPNIPTLDEIEEGKDGRTLTTRERMEIHSENPTCNACHQYMDPIGLALDNFDVTGKWRYRENGMLLDTRGTMYDGLEVSTPTELLTSLMSRPIPLVRAFTENLMAYANGRRVEDFDQPTVRRIVEAAAKDGYKMSAFVAGVVNSAAFRNRLADVVSDNSGGSQFSHDKQR
ncbi:MAG: DUF1592 domain-containing protein [Gemmatimonadetes bacterium]|nr:DUF1592 domain-containing protein [Gemmatimonadota bacterium]